MSKNTPKARFVRTLIASIAGYAGSWAAIEWATDYENGIRIVTLNLLAAVMAGGIAYLQALRSPHPRDAFGKMLYTFAQNLAPGLGLITLTEISKIAAIGFVKGIITTTIGALLAALATLGMNASEDA